MINNAIPSTKNPCPKGKKNLIFFFARRYSTEAGWCQAATYYLAAVTYYLAAATKLSSGRHLIYMAAAT